MADGPEQKAPFCLSSFPPSSLFTSGPPPSPTQTACWPSLQILAFCLFIWILFPDISLYRTQIFLLSSTLGSRLHLFHPLPSVRLSPGEETPPPGLSPPAKASSFWWGKRSSEMVLPHIEQGLKVPATCSAKSTSHLLPVAVSPSHPTMAGRTWLHSLAPVPWVRASTICQSLKGPPPYPCHLTCFFCVYFFVFMGFFGAI